MLTSVRPSFKDGVTHVAMSVLARQAGDLEEFMDKLEATGSFTDVVPASQDRTEDGLARAMIESVYVRPEQTAGAPAEPAAPPPSAPATGRGAAAPAPPAPSAAPSQREGGRR
jgi:hypothetical protein